MICALLVFAVAAPGNSLNILFLGNSHTAFNEVPTMVKNLIESDDTGKSVRTKLRTAGFVEELANDRELKKDISSRSFQAVVMQGAKLSSSHKYEYDHSGAVEIAKFAKKNGVDAWLFAEWPRRGWKETGYILKEYREISEPSGARIIPVCKSWDRLLATGFNQELWSSDGNHATAMGSYVAACTIAAHLSPSKSSKWRPTFVDPKSATLIMRIAREVAAGK